MSATHQIHVLSLEDQPEVWLDTEVAECDGLCLGSGDTLAEAQADAIEELEAALSRVLLINPDTYPLLSREWTDDAKQRRLLNEAAPDLLEAARAGGRYCDALRPHLDAGASGTFIQDAGELVRLFVDWHGKMRAAVAKAEGQS